MEADACQYVEDAVCLLEQLYSEPSDAPNNEQHRLNRYRDWLQRWLTTNFVVGVIGVTSSGKSTFINAVLGERLLVSRVRPSSNTVVECYHAEHTRLTLEFEHGEPLVTTAAGKQELEELATLIKQHTDEELNPGNHKQVKTLGLSSPDFRLGKEVTLVDTPGLNAFGLPEHEELTWLIALPKMDMVIFLGTVKASSDAQTKQYFQRLQDVEKPVLLVQNMKDSVEAKLENGGTIARTEEQVLADHAQRFRRLAEGVFGKEQCPPIVQISATQALNDGTYSISGFSSLEALVEQQIASLRPQVDLMRRKKLRADLQQLLSGMPQTASEGAHASASAHDALNVESLLSLLDSIEAIPQEFGKSMAKALSKPLEHARSMQESVQGRRQNTQNGTSSALGVWSTIMGSSLGSSLGVGRGEPANGLSGHWSNIDAVDEDQAEVMWDEMTHCFTEAMKKLIQVVGTYSARASSMAQSLRLSEAEFRRTDSTHSIRHSKASLKFIEKTEEYRVEKSGFFAWGARLIGVGGYETRIQRYSVLNVKKFKQDLAARIADNMGEVNAAMAQSQETVASWSIKLHVEASQQLDVCEETGRMQALLAQQRQLQVQLDELFQKLECSLQGQAAPTLRVEPTCITPSSNTAVPLETFSLTEAALCIGHLASSIVSRAHVAARESCMGNAAPSAVFVTGWDGASLEQFLRLFWSEYVPPTLNLQAVESCTGTERLERARMHFAAPAEHLPELCVLLVTDTETPEQVTGQWELCRQRLSELSPQSPPVTFLLADGIQVGDMISKINNSPTLLDVLSQSSQRVLCLQSGRVYYNLEAGNFNATDFVEGIDALRQFHEEHGLEMHAALVNDRNIGLSLLANYLMRHDKNDAQSTVNMVMYGKKFFDSLTLDKILTVHEQLKKM